MVIKYPDAIAVQTRLNISSLDDNEVCDCRLLVHVGIQPGMDDVAICQPGRAEPSPAADAAAAEKARAVAASVADVEAAAAGGGGSGSGGAAAAAGAACAAGIGVDLGGAGLVEVPT